MAQHIPIEAFKQKAFRTIERSIRGQQNIAGSLRFERQSFYDDNSEVFYTERTIPKGIIFNDTRGAFEVHTQKQGNKRIVTNIYLVA